jgi:formylmethanofuran dehydrogenase subunit A
MLVKLSGGTVYDPQQGIDGEVRDLYFRDGRMVPPPGESPDREYDVRGKVVMAGGIDIHTHIGGGKVNLSRTLLPEDHRDHPVCSEHHRRSGSGHITPSTFTTGYRYAEMGYTACFEPALLPSNARQAHLELGDTPMVDKGGYALLGNDDLLLGMLAKGEDQARINDYVAWTLNATRCLAIKVVNPGGIAAFKFNGRKLDVDEANPHYGVKPRTILNRLTRALHDLGVPHPLHVHSSNLGVPGNVASTLDTIRAAEGLPIHLTHIQFHSYGTEGSRGFSSAAAEIAEAINTNPNVSADVGQVMFGQTVTASGDFMHQYAQHEHAHPSKWIGMDTECDAGCGVVPFKYRDENYVNALQWAIGLEVFLQVDDPWRVFLTTDHPNGGPFTSYPHLIKLLMDRSFRNERLEQLHADVAEHSHLKAMEREYSLYEIAILTRAGPARILGLTDRGHLGEGAAADIAVYDHQPDPEAMFARPSLVFKDGEPVIEDGHLTQVRWGGTHAVAPEYDAGIEDRLADYFERYHTVRLGNFKIAADELAGPHSPGLLPVQTTGGRQQ